MTTKQIKEKYNIGETTIRKWVRSGKLKIQENYKQGQCFQINEEELLKVKKLFWDDEMHRSYSIGWNRSIFSKIDSPEKAYWLGFILADGCIHFTKKEKFEGHFSIDISGKDVHHLEKFSSFIEAQSNIIQHTKHNITGNDLVHVQLSCSSTLRDLFNLGIKPRKSGEEKWIETPYPADFIRGCYDGDGYIKKDLTSIGIVGSYELLYNIQQHFKQNLGLIPKTIGNHGKIYRIEYTSIKDKKAIANYLWYDNCVSLDRKQILADKIKKIC